MRSTCVFFGKISARFCPRVEEEFPNTRGRVEEEVSRARARGKKEFSEGRAKIEPQMRWRQKKNSARSTESFPTRAKKNLAGRAKSIPETRAKTRAHTKKNGESFPKFPAQKPTFSRLRIAPARLRHTRFAKATMRSASRGLLKLGPQPTATAAESKTVESLRSEPRRPRSRPHPAAWRAGDRDRRVSQARPLGAIAASSHPTAGAASFRSHPTRGQNLISNRIAERFAV